MTIHIFSYGSNMCTERIRARVPSAVVVGCGYVTARRFVFHKRGIDGSAKADAFHTAQPQDRVWGAVFKIARTEKPILDQHEHLGIGYDEEHVTVAMQDGGNLQAWMYVARQEALDYSLKPFSWYKEFVLVGARQHALPSDYVRQLAEFACIADSDTERDRQHRMLITKWE